MYDPILGFALAQDEMRDEQEKKVVDFYELVASMRKVQKEYFRTKDANALNESKRLEKEVDKALKEHEEDKLGRLF